MKNLVILAGGHSSRMGRDKVLLKLNGMALIERIFTNALICFDRIIISTDTREHAESIAELPVLRKASQEGPVRPEYVIDLYHDLGPMGGVLSVWETSDVDRFAIISVDVPFADMRVLEALFDRCEKKAVFLKIGERRSEPLIAAYDRTSSADIARAVSEGLLKMRRAFDREDIDVVSDSSLKREIPELKELDFEKAFANYNTPEEYACIEN